MKLNLKVAKNQLNVVETANDPDPEAVISQHENKGTLVILSRYKDVIWLGAQVGGNFASHESMRRISFEGLKESWRTHKKKILFGLLKQPTRINHERGFSSLIKKSSTLDNLYDFLKGRGRDIESATEDDFFKFFEYVTAKSHHIETVVNHVATIYEIKRLAKQGVLSWNPQVKETREGARKVAENFWLRVKKITWSDTGGIQPFPDEDFSIIVRSALFYIETLAPSILSAIKTCDQVRLKFPNYRNKNGDQKKLSHAQSAALSSIDWPAADSGLSNWPPKCYRDLKAQLRVLSGACAIILFAFLGCRRTELIGLTDNCLTSLNGRPAIRIVYRKGELDLSEGRLVKIPICNEVVDAVKVLKRIKSLASANRKFREVSAASKNHLFVQSNFLAAPSNAEGKVENRDLSRKPANDENGDFLLPGITWQTLDVSGLNSLLINFGKRVTPEITVSLTSHRFRKSMARLVALSMNGAPLILQTLFGHTSIHTTIKYIFSSPFMQDEIMRLIPELAAENLATIINSRAELGGTGGKQISQALRNEEDPTDNSAEVRFLNSTANLIARGDLTLTTVAPGVYCLKSTNSPGECTRGNGDIYPNIGKCTSTCSNNIQMPERRPRVERTISHIKQKLDDPLISAPMKKYFSSQLAEYENIF